MRSRLIKQGRKHNAAWDERSPHFAEAMHVGQYAYLAKVTKCPLYIVHTTNPGDDRRDSSRPVEICSEIPVKAFGLYPKKGVLRVGADADLVIADLKKKQKIDKSMLLPPRAGQYSAVRR